MCAKWIYKEGISQEEIAIVEIFRERVYLKKPILDDYNISHDGKEGHWLENQMGISPNSSNSADIKGFEMKKDSTSKITFGDWSADYYIFKSRSNKQSQITRSDFIYMFGKPNPDKEGRPSWSGTPIPSIMHS